MKLVGRRLPFGNLMVQKQSTSHSTHTNMTHHYQPFAMVNQNLFSHQFYWLLSDEGWKNEHIMTLALKIHDSYCSLMAITGQKLTSHL